MPRYRATIQYDGTDFHGFQRQVNHRTVQGQLETALNTISPHGSTSTVLGAGRTDSGVHASGQVITFDLDWQHPTEALLRALNANLPADIVVWQMAIAEPDFHPRYRASARTYQYNIAMRPHRSPLADRFMWQVWPPPDLNTLQALAQAIHGSHDFAGFGSPLSPGASTTRTVYLADWQANGQQLVFTIQANAFLYRMVRRLVGSMQRVANGQQSMAEFIDILATRGPLHHSPAAPAHGLTLTAVSYPNE